MSHSLERRSRTYPKIIPVSDAAYSALLPYSGTGEQILIQLSDPEMWARRMSVSMIGAIFLYNFHVLLAVLASLYWVWSPMFLATKENTILRLRYSHGALWRAEITDIEFLSLEDVHVIIGDESGISIEMFVHPPKSGNPIHRGDPVELLVLSDSSDFTRFRALREAYLPRQNVWLAEGSNVERSVFEEMSAELASMAATCNDEADDWEAEYALAATDHEQDVESYRPYDDDVATDDLQLGIGFGTPGWKPFGRRNYVGGSGQELDINNVPIWSLLSEDEIDRRPDEFRDKS